MRNKERGVIVILMVGISLITYILGCLMYYANLKKTAQNTIGVELADFIYNINYSMQFGKQIETFYGMDERLQEEKEQFSDIRELYIISEDGDILFSTAEQIPKTDIISMPIGENKTEDASLFCMYKINDHSRILVQRGMDDILEKAHDYELRLAVEAAAGTAAAVLIMLILSFIIKKERKASAAATAVLIVWVVGFGSTIGLMGYQTYSDSVDTVFTTIRYSVLSDFDKIESMGVEKEEIHETDQYLERYLEMVPEIEEIHMEQDEIKYERSSSYIGKVLLDYILQTILLLTFSILILTEYKIFTANTRAKEAEVQNE